MKRAFWVTVCLVSLIAGLAATAQADRAFIWNSANGLRDLGTLDGDDSYAFGINSSSQVVGSIMLNSDVPEPSSLLALVCGISGLGVAIRRGRR